jgi:hypothetical protein
MLGTGAVGASASGLRFCTSILPSHTSLSSCFTAVGGEIHGKMPRTGERCGVEMATASEASKPARTTVHTTAVKQTTTWGSRELAHVCTEMHFFDAMQTVFCLSKMHSIAGLSVSTSTIEIVFERAN